MKEKIRWIAVLILCAGAIVTLLICTGLISVQAGAAENEKQPKGSPTPKPGQSPPVYNPYPAGILPPDLNSEIARVLREVDFIEARAVARAQALTPPILTGQHPIIKTTGTEAVK